jgi:hypothetical protein
VPPANAVLTRDRLKLRELPIEGIAAHSL